MRHEILQQGFIHRRQPDAGLPVAIGSRCAALPDGGLLCTFMLQSAVGTNDFQPVICRLEAGGEHWSDPEPIWPRLAGRWSIFGSVSRQVDDRGDLLFFGTRTPITEPGESVWQAKNNGLRQNELIWARSADAGRTWSDPQPIASPTPGSAEAPGPICVTRDGRWLACYSPYNSFDLNLDVATNQVICLRSDDRGQSWHHSVMLGFPDATDGTAESWVVELADGRLLGASWHISHRTGADHPNPYAISHDGGVTWTKPAPLGIEGQTIALSPLPDGGAVLIYNQRRRAPVGIHMAELHPTGAGPGLCNDQLIWQAATATQQGQASGHDSWTDFAYGEPAPLVLPDNTVLVCFWCIQPDNRGIGFVRVKPAPGAQQAGDRGS